MTTVPSLTWRMLSQPVQRRPLAKGFDVVWERGLGIAQRIRRRRSHFLHRARGIVATESEFTTLSDARLRETCDDLHALFRRSREMPADIDRAFAVIREVAFRQLGQRAFAVQVAGALAVDAGCVIEMATGEGKTLVAAIAAVAAGWRGRGCHVITVNDYLAERDADWMKGIYAFSGLRVACVKQDTPPPERRQAYLADVTYCTNKEAAADFLRDSLILGRRRSLTDVLVGNIVDRRNRSLQLAHRGLHCAIVDEADSVLLDEAVTPLIISGDAPNAEQVESFAQAAELATELNAGEHYRVNHRFRDIELNETGRTLLAKHAVPLGGIWRSTRRREELVNQALQARELFLCDQQYVIQEGKIVIVDESTGRLMPDRTWRDGLHQAVEAKELLTINPPKSTFARISFQRFFRMYGKLAGLTGTGVEGRAEFWRVYNLPVVRIPTNRPIRRRKLPDRCFTTADTKWTAIVNEIRDVHATGKPILIGTRSVGDSEHLSARLTVEDLPHRILNAVRVSEEAQIIAEAGARGAITVATNMAGRGTDIKLGRGVSELGGLHVIATERHSAGRIDRQLYGRAGRQGDPGSAIAFVSLEDELIQRHASGFTRIAKTIPANETGQTWIFDRAQTRAERQAFAQRRAVLQTDDWLDEFLGFAV